MSAVKRTPDAPAAANTPATYEQDRSHGLYGFFLKLAKREIAPREACGIPYIFDSQLACGNQPAFHWIKMAYQDPASGDYRVLEVTAWELAHDYYRVDVQRYGLGPAHVRRQCSLTPTGIESYQPEVPPERGPLSPLFRPEQQVDTNAYYLAAVEGTSEIMVELVPLCRVMPRANNQ